MKRTLYIIALLAGLAGCITEYTPKGLEEVTGLLIVDGTITDGESTFTLRHSVGLTDTLTGRETIDNASLYVEREDGGRMNGVFQGAGRYTVQTGDLDFSTRYRLHISIDGEEYESTYLAPLKTPEIDSLAPLKRGQGEPVFMCVNTHDPADQSRFYRWSYKEIWEVKAELFANVYVDDGGGIVYQDLYTPNNRYYCWGRDSSKILLLGSTEKLTANVISQNRLIEISCTDDRLSLLYYIHVEQMQIRKETYDYFNNVQKNIDQTGSIFAPVPSEMSGNISCLSDPDLRVIGFIEVTTTTRDELFVPVNQGLYEAPRSTCSQYVTDDPEYAYPVYAYLFYDSNFMMPEHEYAPFQCVDCRTKSKATKNRPDFWPNDHH